MYYSQINSFDVANGEGIRVSLFVSGCSFHCKGCFNPEAWEYNYGKEYTQETEDYILKLLNNENIRGLSVLGGDPLCQDYKGLNQLIHLLDKVQEMGKDVWVWSGYTWDELFDEELDFKDTLMQDRRTIIALADVFVEGRFEEDKKDLSLAWRGSSNQRVINVNASLWKKPNEERDITNPILYVK